MFSFLLIAALGLPDWVGEAEIRPARRVKTVEVEGDEAPPSVLLMPPRRQSSVSIEGPGRVSVELFGLAIQRRRRMLGPGSVVIRKGKKQLARVRFSGEPLAWRAPERQRWRFIAAQPVELELEPGPNVLSFKPDRGARAGFFLRFSQVAPPEAAPEDDPAPPAPPPPPPELESASAPASNEPALVAEPESSPIEDGEPGFAIVEPAPPSQTITSPDGDGFFLKLEAADGLNLTARGTGVLVFDFHAHRNPSEPATLEPAVLAVLLDDVLVETLKIDAPASDNYAVEGAPYTLSERAQFQVTVPPGPHRVTITLSDTALAGGSMRVRFEAPDVESVDQADSVVPPEPPPMVEIRETGEDESPDPTWVGLALSGGGALGNSSGQPGYAGLVDFFVMPRDFGRIFGLGFTSGFATVRTSESVPDIRAAGQNTSVELVEYAIPVLADLRLAIDLGELALLIGAGGGGLVSWAETEALGGRAETGTNFSWAATGHVSLMARAGLGWLSVRGQLTLTEPTDVGNLRDWDPGAFTLTLGYTFSSY